jgi:hypothetical protein
MRNDRRAIDRPRLSRFEIRLARLCRNAGVTFVGVQKKLESFPAQVIVLKSFQSSFCVPVEDFSLARLLVE